MILYNKNQCRNRYRIEEIYRIQLRLYVLYEKNNSDRHNLRYDVNTCIVV